MIESCVLKVERLVLQRLKHHRIFIFTQQMYGTL